MSYRVPWLSRSGGSGRSHFNLSPRGIRLVEVFIKKAVFGDPDPQGPHVFGSPGSGSISQR
jgi:hypothetical protein